MPWGVAAAVAGTVVSKAISGSGSSSSNNADVGSAVGGGVGSYLTGQAQSDAITTGQKEAIAAEQPYATQGVTANKAAADLTGINGADAATAAMANFTASPGYGYQVSQGLRAVDAGAASKGILGSGATIKAEQTLGSNLANQDFSNYVGRLNALTTTGAAASKDIASTDTSAAGQQSKISGSTGNALTNGLTTALGTTGVQNALSKAGDWITGSGSSSDPSVASDNAVLTNNNNSGIIDNGSF